MKKVFKFLSLALLLVVVLALTACTRDDEETPVGQPDADGPNIRIALIAHSPESILDDGSFNAGAWQGILQFARENGLSTSRGVDIEFFQPGAGTDDARIDLVESAIQNFGANVIVMPGHHFIASSYEMQNLFPDTYFILLDASPAGAISSNLVAIHYAEEESGFLAGYAAVMNGYRNLGFMGGVAVPAVVRFGTGFIEGAEYAANELGLAEGEVTINYAYAGTFSPAPEVQTMAASWYNEGVEVIFAAAGGAGFSVFAAAEAANALAIGVDIDQAGASDTVITSALKGLEASVYSVISDFFAGDFPGGIAKIFDASLDGVGLPMDTSRFENFTQDQYDDIFQRLANDEIDVSTEVGPEAHLNLNLSLVDLINIG